MKFSNDDLQDLLTGAAFLATGGGGDLQAGRELLAGIDRLELVDLSDVDSDHVCATPYLVGSIAAPTLSELRKKTSKVVIHHEKQLISGAFQVLQDNYAEKIDYIIPVELGGHNTAVALNLAAEIGLPILNGDLTGRSAPEIYQTGYYVGGISPSPAGVYTAFGDKVYIENETDYEKFDTQLRNMIINCHGFDVGVANFPVHIGQATPYIIKKSLTSCMSIGALLTKGLVAEAIAKVDGKIIFQGTIRAEKYRNLDGFSFGSVTIDGSEGTLRLEYKNEILAAFMDSMMIAHVPDLIGVVDVTGMPLQNTRYGQGTEVIVYTVPAPAIWQVGKGRQVFDLKHFGY